MSEEPQQPQKSGSFSWDEWYAKNKTRLSEKRARRYREDPSYRQAALERARHQRQTKKVHLDTPYTVSFNEAAQTLDVTVWVLREWRRKNYFPEPHRRDGRLWFTPSQVDLLKNLMWCFRTHGSRVSSTSRPLVDGVVNLVYCNW